MVMRGLKQDRTPGEETGPLLSLSLCPVPQPAGSHFLSFHWLTFSGHMALSLMLQSRPSPLSVLFSRSRAGSHCLASSLTPQSGLRFLLCRVESLPVSSLLQVCSKGDWNRACEAGGVSSERPSSTGCH